MKFELAEMMVETAEGAGDFEVELYEDYSGRSMYGDTTTGIVCESEDLMKLVAFTAFFMGESDQDELLSDLTRLKTDNMGMRIIVY